MVVLPLLFLLGVLCRCGHVEAQSSTTEMLKQAALQLKETLTCDKWDCNCTFNRQRGCCCAAPEMYQIEEDTFIRMTYLWNDISTLNDKVQALTASMKFSFKATMDSNIAVVIPGSTEHCFGPFNTNVPIPYSIVSLNDGYVYNPSLGVFTATRAGVYVFSFTAYSSVEANGRLYHKVQLVKNGKPISGVWENNREDGEDSASQVVMLEMMRGDQVYTELISGRKLCKHLEFNVFSGYMMYPSNDE
ncbi:cerebellin 18 [Thunnus albacares]|uniref:cerebellin 18 n=1 Tax=Thunnus maccoyii TaxID=8240 RepID=UPI001C4C89FE|nr:cerebellin 18 [Thunnus maccoyii]XP_042270903.1 cerebellin 18 [Thunnus maccoyii]XP_044210542.1 cerebellin 18 [Thunnus albacares]